MSDKLRIRIAATVTAVFLAGISAAGLATHTGAREKLAGPAPAVAIQPPAPQAVTQYTGERERSD